MGNINFIMISLVGFSIDNYRVVGFVGKGAQGDAYLVLNQSDELQVLKVYARSGLDPIEIYNSKAAKAAEEFEIVHKMNKEKIIGIPVYHDFKADGSVKVNEGERAERVCYIVMDYIKGIMLYETINMKKPDESFTCNVAH